MPSESLRRQSPEESPKAQLDSRLPEVTVRELEALASTMTTLFSAMKMHADKRDDPQLDAHMLMDAWRAGCRMLERDGQDSFAFSQTYNGVRADIAARANMAVSQAHIDDAPAERVDFMDAAGHGLVAVVRTQLWPEGGSAANLERLRVFEDAIAERLRHIRPEPSIVERNAGTIIAAILAAIILLIAEANKSAPRSPLQAPGAPQVPVETPTDEERKNHIVPPEKQENPPPADKPKPKMIESERVLV